jgi:hypothetical protein
MRLRLLALPILFIAFFSGTAEARQTSVNVRQRLETLAAETSYFATGEIVDNRWTEERRWPPGLLEEQQHVVAELRALTEERDALRALLDDRNPKVRTLALGALFIREEPHDLPLIARLSSDSAATFTRLGMAATSMGGRLPISYFESPQTVGDVAQEMIRFYLGATGRPSFGGAGTPFNRQRSLPPSAFDDYWAQRSSRAHCASWFLVKMRRATRQTSPLQLEYEPDVRRVLAEIDALPPVERAWTLLYVRADQGQIDVLVPDAAVVNALRAVGPDALMTFLRREAPTDDPDVRAGAAYRGSMTGLVLAHAPELLRASDADAVIASTEAYTGLQNNTMFVAAAGRLRGVENVERAAHFLKTAIAAIPVRRTLGVSDQATLAFALWQIRGAAEDGFLVDWFYAAAPFDGSPSGTEEFLRNVDKEARSDTGTLFAAVVADSRFDQVGWTQLARILVTVNRSLASPLVDQHTIDAYWPGLERPDEQATLASWRRLLRHHFGLLR